MPAVLALLSAALWGVGDFLGGLASRRSTPLQTLLITTPAGLLLVLPFAFLVPGSAAGSAVPGIAAGCVGSIGILLLYAALSIGPMGVVSPVSAVLGAAIPVLAGLLRGERPGTWAYLGMALAVVAIITVGLEPASPTDDSTHQRVTPRALLLAVGAGIGIGLFFTFVSFAPSDAGLWPVVFARTTSTVVLGGLAVIVALRRRTPLLPPASSVRWQSVAAGGFDAWANAVYVLAVQTGLLSVVAVLGSLYPAATVLLARYVLAERLRPTQKIGMVTALVAAVLLAVPA
ncbi:MAG TPA: EamA family transporter [Candidatus Nanopelagicales bacterium]|nr:EamA family transporter [Candidatus Nanopelagicales bacterium]